MWDQEPKHMIPLDLGQPLEEMHIRFKTPTFSFTGAVKQSVEL